LALRQLATPTAGNERVFICIVAGTTHATTEPTWVVTRGAKTTDNTVTWQECTGIAALNGDLTDTPNWTSSKAAASTPSLGVIIKDASNNLFICTTSGAMGGSEPAWNTTVGNTTTDSGATWTCIKNGAFSNWAAPHARLTNAFASTWGSFGDDFYVGDNHAETQAAAMTLTAPGSFALSQAPSRIICVNVSGSVPPVSADLRTTATVSTTGANNIEFRGTAAPCRGIIFSAGDGASNASLTSTFGADIIWVFEACQLKLGGTGSSSLIQLTVSGATKQIVLNNTTVRFAAAGQSIRLAGILFEWKNTASAVAGTAPTTLFTASNSGPNIATITGVDLSALGSGNNLVSIQNSGLSDYRFVDCKLGSSVSVATGTHIGPGGVQVRLVNCDSTNTNYRYHKQTYQGTITHEATIVRTSGASDGTTSFSRKMVSTANSRFYSPLESDPIYIWNDTTGSSKTATIPIITDNVTLKDNEAWLEVEYLGTSGFPIGSFANDGAADVLNAGTNQATDGTSTWTTTGLGTPVKQTLDVTFTPQMKGLIKLTVKLAKASTTMYYDPKPTIA
jgi:hypothetical protein